MIGPAVQQHATTAMKSFDKVQNVNNVNHEFITVALGPKALYESVEVYTMYVYFLHLKHIVNNKEGVLLFCIHYFVDY